MLRALLASLAIVVSNGALQVKAPKPKPASYQPAAQSVYSSAASYDTEAERELLVMANQARAQAGVPPLQLDEGLTQAAREHASSMAAQQQLSHQFSGEPSLAQRLAVSTSLHLNQAGENVASAASVEQVQESLMLSPPHRENLLNPAYNVAGFAVVRSGDSLYLVQDFGHGSQINSSQQSENMVAESVIRMREKSDRSALQRLDGSGVRAVACSMAQADSLNV